LYRCPGSAVCIIGTIWQPELLLRTSLVKTEDDRREKCVCRSLATRLALPQWLFVVILQPAFESIISSKTVPDFKTDPLSRTDGILARDRQT
jgi:hypothetical protein